LRHREVGRPLDPSYPRSSHRKRLRSRRRRPRQSAAVVRLEHEQLELESAELFRLDNLYWHDDAAVFARDYVRSVLAWGGPLLHRAFAREGEDRAPALLAAFLEELEERVADAPERYRWDYIEALVICRKADGTEQNPTRPSN
jgi:hypothetical protein